MNNRRRPTLLVILLSLLLSAARSQRSFGEEEDPFGSPEQADWSSPFDLPDDPFNSGGGSPPELDGMIDQLFATSRYLPAEIMAWLGDARYLPIIREQIQSASTHRRTFLEACARACGTKPSCVINISEKCPGDFRPASATGTGDTRRMPVLFAGQHGDGHTLICVTGRIVMEDGTPVVEPKFFNTNDRMLLGRRLKDRARIKYDAQTGRFVFLTNVFAAYAFGERAEPGPYQTGPARVSIEARGCKPLKVSFFDEMPEVLITLSAEE